MPVNSPGHPSPKDQQIGSDDATPISHTLGHIPDEMRLGAQHFGIGPLATPLNNIARHYFLSAIAPAIQHTLPADAAPNRDGMYSYETSYTGLGTSDPRRMLVTLGFDDRNLRGITATAAQFGIPKQHMQGLNMVLTTALFDTPIKTENRRVPQQIQTHGTLVAPPPVSSFLSLGPAGSSNLRNGQFILFNKHLHKAVQTCSKEATLRLADNQSLPRRQQISALLHKPLSWTPSIEQAELAQQKLDDARARLVEKNPVQLQKLYEETREVGARFFSETPPMRNEIINALTNYQAPGCDILMNIALQGYKSLRDYLLNLDPVKYASNAEVETYCKDMISYGHYDGYDPSELLSHFENDIQNDIVALKTLLDNGVTLNGLTVATGAKMIDEPRQIDWRNYVAAFLNSEPLHHNGFMRTSTMWDEASDFTDQNNPCSNARLILDLTDFSPDSLHQRAAVLKDLRDPNHRTAVLIMILECNNAKGILTHFNALNMHDTLDFSDQNTVLLAPNHVNIPKYLIQTDDGYVLIGNVTHISNLTGS